MAMYRPELRDGGVCGVDSVCVCLCECVSWQLLSEDQGEADTNLQPAVLGLVA